MRQRVVGIETEYALIYHPGNSDLPRPTNLQLYRHFEAVLLRRIGSLPHAFSPLRSKGGRFLENGGTFHYEATAQEYEHGLLELASPECRDPYRLIHYERAKDELVEDLAEDVNRRLQLAGYTGELRLGKNNVDSQGHTFGSHESYWVEDPLPLGRLALFLPPWLLLWAISAPVIAAVFALQIAVLIAGGLLGLSLLLLGSLLRRVWPRAGWSILDALGRFSRDIETQPGRYARRLQWLVGPLYGLMRVHSHLYNLFFLRDIRRNLTAHLITRTLFTGAGAVRFDGGPLVRLAQRPPFLKSLARIFPEGDDRPIFEMRDLFFFPWSPLRRHRRLHLLIGDANLSEWAQVLRVGTTALVLEAIEAGKVRDWPELADPMDALIRVNDDPQLETRLELLDGSSATALELQRRYYTLVSRALSEEGATTDAWKNRVLHSWGETLEALERDPESLCDRIDWLAKRRQVHAQVPDPADRMELEQRGERLTARAVNTDAERRLRDLAFRAWKTDLRYHELGPRGGYRRLERQGEMLRISQPTEVERARTEPPRNTRAWARGQAIKWAHAHAASGHAAWHRVRLGKLDWRFFRDPLDPQDDEDR
ncbi:MAG: hypothetical protein GY725_02755 [bacterium]|nr:hypothetical protein [bacterium]